MAARSALPYEESEGEVEGEDEQGTVAHHAAEANVQSSQTAMELDVTDITSPKVDRPEKVETDDSKPKETTLEKWGTF